MLIFLININNTRIKMNILLHVKPQKVCQKPRPKEIKRSVGKEKMTNWVVITMIKVCVQFLNHCFASYEASTVSLQFCCSSIFLCLCFASVIVLLCFCYCFIILMLYIH